jgi:transposase
LDVNPRINTLFLPEHSPNFNPKENFWNYVRKKFLNNKVFKTVEEMAKEVKKFIRKFLKRL